MGAVGEPTQLGRARVTATPTRPLRIAFVVTGLDVGGAEMMLWKLLSRLDRTRFEPSVIALSGEARAMLPAFREIGIECELLGWRGSRLLSGVRNLARALRERRPDLVQGWMYHGNIAATLAVKYARLRVPVVWNVRATLMERRHEKPLTLFTIWLGGKLSSSPAAIVNNSATSAEEHERRMGYARRKRVVLPNGFDVERFAPAADKGIALRRSLGIAETAVIVGFVARYHPMKGHDVFMRAAGEVSRTHPNVHFVLAGDGVTEANSHLAQLVEEPGLANRVHLLGRRSDMAAVTAAFDVAVCASTSGEGFPNVIGEAMSCGVPCAVTDIGDSAAIVGDTGMVVAPGDAHALAGAIAALAALPPDERSRLAERARRRAVEHFSLPAVVRQYEALYTRLHQEQGSA